MSIVTSLLEAFVTDKRKVKGMHLNVNFVLSWIESWLLHQIWTHYAQNELYLKGMITGMKYLRQASYSENRCLGWLIELARPRAFSQTNT